MLAICIALGVPFCGIPTQRRRVFFLSSEDSEAVLHLRLAAICKWLGRNLSDLSGWLTIADATLADAELVTKRRGELVTTPRYSWLRRQMKGHQVLFIDGASDAYGADEIKRNEVKAFVRHIRRLIPRDGAAVILAHVDKGTARDGETSEGYSGSTAWHNSVRARMYLRREAKDSDALLLELQKSNYGQSGASIRLTFNESAHVFVGECQMPATRLERAHAEADEREAIVSLIREAAEPIPAAVTGPRTAYKVLQAHARFPAGLNGYTGKQRFWRHLEALRAAGAVTVETIRTAQRKTSEVLRAR